MPESVEVSHKQRLHVCCGYFVLLVVVVSLVCSYFILFADLGFLPFNTVAIVLFTIYMIESCFISFFVINIY